MTILNSLITRVALITLIILFTITINIYFSFQEHQKFNNETITNHFNTLLSEQINKDITYSIDTMTILGKVISKNCTDGNIDCVHNFLTIFADDSRTDYILPRSKIGWVSQDLKARTDSLVRSIIPPIDLRHSPYIQVTKDHPSEIVYGKLTKGYISKRLILPIGIGITSFDNRYLGTLTIGIDIGNLIFAIKKIVPKNFSFSILDKSTSKVIYSNFDNQEINFPWQYDNSKHNIIQISKTPLYIKSQQYKNNHVEQIHLFIQEHSTLLISIIALLSVAFISFFVFLIQPTLKLSKYASQIINKQSNKIELPSYTTMEFKYLKFVLDQISLYIEEQQKLISELNQLLRSNNNLQEEIDQHTKHLQIALTAKTEFLNNMSHEIRTPMQGFSAISQGLVDHWDNLDDAKKLNFAKQIASNAIRLTSLLGGILDLSKFDNGKILLHFTEVNLNKLIENIVDEAQTLYLTNKNVNFVVQTPDLIIFQADQERISQLLRNIVFNAIKFTPNDGKISIYAKLNKSIVEIKIKDTGIGIPESELKDIFHPFTQSSRTKTNAGGTGLGLAIALEIVTAHKGKIWVENNKNGIGSCFYINLPIDGKSITNKKQTNVNQIIVIDDEDSCLVAIELMLKEKCDVTTFNDPILALQYLETNHKKVDYILLDLMMPIMDGIEVLKNIKSSFPTIRVIIQSGSSDTELINQAIEIGAVDYIPKPYNKNIIMTTLGL